LAGKGLRDEHGYVSEEADENIGNCEGGCNERLEKIA
jgi:hypothetical protein